ncbi:hypothetical protein SADUNF_Sadunf18G0088100 [Salix dunnii]|uniref:Uncharacterized protein n=1 Tax=Salix dunnii TaxID=1413687 RepID=A0A835MGI4_9ROSI|nr:hypothetical protein SADUNF_Sadunf18G0088100 [Salix dunnii]
MQSVSNVRVSVKFRREEKKHNSKFNLLSAFLDIPRRPFPPSLERALIDRYDAEMDAFTLGRPAIGVL